ncbi:unnamed protein product [Effrenium voratum]|uniref:Uncharacterized protein n=1 Tax=Effrenium voratum TaxID=2562239 RepID=A0AA36HYX8_9DINO|nr:unnamed protein product [Effrenium voratum]CAJ1451687.1 unnamed protein product [Effrenium voratum]
MPETVMGSKQAQSHVKQMLVQILAAVVSAKRFGSERLAGLRPTLAWLMLALAARAGWTMLQHLRGYVHLRISAPLKRSGVKYAKPCAHGWRAPCPCCKRPLDIQLAGPETPQLIHPEAKGRFAYLICLWGSSPEYIAGALVLGSSIQRTGSKHDRVCMYTEDVPKEYIRLLSKFWRCKCIDHVDAVLEQLSFPDREERFANVFTKLRGLGLTEYEKVLMMDIDLLVMSNIDELFDLPAPAALRRGMNEWGRNCHGEPIDGRSFLLGEDKSMPRWSWGQGTGINAGVMLWQPNQEVLEQMLAELSEPNHPEHVRGNGPEQDYLSRFWADAPWTYIGVQYNFQLHQMFFALHPDRAQYAERANLLHTPEEIKVIHYSGKPTAKPWHRVLDDKWRDFWPSRCRDDEYVHLFAEEFMGYWLWVKRDRAKFESQKQVTGSWDLAGMELTEDGEYCRTSKGYPEVLHIPEAVNQGAMNILSLCLSKWFDIYASLEEELGIDLRSSLMSAGHCKPSPAPTLSMPRTETLLKHTAWRRTSRGGWWVEAEKSDKGEQSNALNKLTATCGISLDSKFVSLRDSTSIFEESGPDVSGLFVKLQGQTAARHFRLDSEDLTPVQFWVAGVPPGATVLVAMVDADAASLDAVLRVLAPLGVPKQPPPSNTRVLSCISVAGSDASQDVPCANHASPDVAYASLLRAESRS